MKLNPIEITEQALAEINYIRRNKGIPPEYGLRVLVEGGGGCGGASFRLGFDTPKEGDQQYEIGDLPVFYEKRQLLYLIGLQIAFEERENERGFVFLKME